MAKMRLNAEWARQAAGVEPEPRAEVGEVFDVNSLYPADWRDRDFDALIAGTEHPAHRGHEYGGAYARAAALSAGDPDWMNAVGGEPLRHRGPGVIRRALRRLGWRS